MDETTLQVYSVLFVLATVVLVYTARYFNARRARRRAQRQIAAFDAFPRWAGRAIESSRPLHLAFGSAGIGEDNTAAALAGAEFFHHVIQRVGAGDASPIVSTSAAATVPLGQDTLRRGWPAGATLTRTQWLPQGKRSIGYAAAVSGLIESERPSAHIFAGSFGPELALMIDSADRRGQGSLAVSDQLQGQAVAYAMADEVLIGEELFAAAGYVLEDGRAPADAIVMDVWRALLIMGMTVALLLEVAKQLPWLSWPAVAVASLILISLGLLVYRRR